MPCEIVIILCGWVGGNDWVRDTIIILICLIFVTWLNKKHLRTSTRLPVIKLNNARVWYLWIIGHENNVNINNIVGCNFLERLIINKEISGSHVTCTVHPISPCTHLWQMSLFHKTRDISILTNNYHQLYETCKGWRLCIMCYLFQVVYRVICTLLDHCQLRIVITMLVSCLKRWNSSIRRSTLSMLTLNVSHTHDTLLHNTVGMWGTVYALHM